MDRAAILAARKERKAAAKAAKQDKSSTRPRRGPSRKGCGVPPAVVDAEPRKLTACPFSGKGGDASACPAAGGKVVG